MNDRFVKLFRRKPKQHTFIYCPGCGAELVAQNAWIKPVVVPDRPWAMEEFHCKTCGKCSLWDFDLYPVPVLYEDHFYALRQKFDGTGS